MYVGVSTRQVSTWGRKTHNALQKTPLQHVGGPVFVLFFISIELLACTHALTHTCTHTRARVRAHTHTHTLTLSRALLPRTNIKQIIYSGLQPRNETHFAYVSEDPQIQITLCHMFAIKEKGRTLPATIAQAFEQLQEQQAQAQDGDAAAPAVTIKAIRGTTTTESEADTDTADGADGASVTSGDAHADAHADASALASERMGALARLKQRSLGKLGLAKAEARISSSSSSSGPSSQSSVLKRTQRSTTASSSSSSSPSKGSGAARARSESAHTAGSKEKQQQDKGKGKGKGKGKKKGAEKLLSPEALASDVKSMGTYVGKFVGACNVRKSKGPEAIETALTE